MFCPKSVDGSDFQYYQIVQIGAWCSWRCAIHFCAGRAGSDGEGHLGVFGNCQEALPGACKDPHMCAKRASNAMKHWFDDC